MPRSIRRLSLLAALAVAAPSGAAAAAREVPLRFTCPDGARVGWTFDEESSITGGTASRRKGSARARVVRDGETCRLELELEPPLPRPPRPPPEPSEPPEPPADPEAAPGAAEPSPSPALVASAEDGRFVRWDGAEAGLADDARLGREEEVWRETIARWAGKTAVPGRTYEERPAGDPEGASPMRVRWAVRRRLPCPGDRRRRCVELWARETPDEDVLRGACAGAASDPARPPRHVVREVVVVSAPDELLPRRAKVETTSRPACPGAGAPGTTERWQRTWTWTR